ncbi:MAG: hypothetical protein Q9186_003164 [Xanthomendoza sp. 1 TL-2023]
MAMVYPPQLDTIYLRNLNISAVIGLDAWGRKDRVQPIVLNIRLKIDTTSSATSDDVNDTFSYGQMSKEITSQLDGKVFTNLQQLITVLTTFAAFWPGEDTKLQALAPKALLRVEGGLEITHSIRKKDRYEENGVPQVRHVDTRSFSIKGLKLACIIGVNKHERLVKQSVNVDLRIPAIDPRTFEAKEGPSENWRTLVNRVCEVVEYSSFETLEALAARIAKTALDSFPVQEITVSVEKPSALTFVEGAGVEITRRKESYSGAPDTSERTSEASARPRMTLDQYKRQKAKDEATPRGGAAGYPPMHQAPTIEQFTHMKRKVDGPDRFVDSGVASPRSLSLQQTPPSNAPRSNAMSPSSSRVKKETSHSVSQSADSASYYVDGSVDHISPVNTPVKSHDFATGKRPDLSSPIQSPKSNKSYLNGQYDYENAAGFNSPSNTNDTAPRISDSSSMFGTIPNQSLLQDDQAPFSADRSEKEVVDGSKGMPTTFTETPKVSKIDSKVSKSDSTVSKPLSDGSYFDKDGELKKEVGNGNGRDDVSIGEAF